LPSAVNVSMISSKMNRLILLVESRIRGDVYVRFGGEYPKTHRSNTAGRWMLSLHMVDGREKTPLYEAYEKAIADLKLSVLKTLLPDTKRFRREISDERKTVFRSTLLPIDKTLLKGSNIEEMAGEICRTVNLRSDGNE